jgi:hypothetical protein
MFDWMYQSREEFLLNYFDIGKSHASSKELQEDHKCFSLSSMVRQSIILFTARYGPVMGGLDRPHPIQFSFLFFSCHLIFLSFQDMYVTVNRLLSLAGRLLDGRHFASSSIRQVALMLEKGWKEFASLLDLRTQVLGLSVTFHQKAEQVMFFLYVYNFLMNLMISFFEY